MNLNYMQTLYIFPSYRLIYVSLSLNGEAPKEINRFKDESISFFSFNKCDVLCNEIRSNDHYDCSNGGDHNNSSNGHDYDNVDGVVMMR